jgi:hypothetical protein
MPLLGNLRLALTLPAGPVHKTRNCGGNDWARIDGGAKLSNTLKLVDALAWKSRRRDEFGVTISTPCLGSSASVVLEVFMFTDTSHGEKMLDAAS